MDNHLSIDNNINNDFSAIIKVNYRQMRRLIDIDALLSTAHILLTQLAAKPAPSNLTLRQVIIMRKSIESRIVEINKHKAKIERINASKVNTQRRQREDAMRYRAENQVLPALIQQTREYRSEQARIDKEQAQLSRAAIVPAIQKQFAEVGFNPRASSEERAEWERLRDINRHAIPGHDLSSQGSDIMQRMNDIENERAAETRKIVTEKTGATALDTDIDKVGTADEWSKLI